MKKQYMDFVPASERRVQPKVKSEKEAAVHKNAVVNPKVKSVDAIKRPEARAVKHGKKTEAQVAKLEKKPKAETTNYKKEVVKLKKEEIKTELISKSVGFETEKKEADASKKSAKGTYEPPKNKFINLNRVEKRPLSKTVYNRKIEVPEEVPKGPITIISKPEKQNHAGLIVTIILTIILGAAAGTMAFVLLPK